MKPIKSEDIRAAFGRAVRRHREGRSPHLSQEKLAEKVEIHRTYENALERGEKNISLDRMVRLAGALGLRLSQLAETMEEELRKGR